MAFTGAAFPPCIACFVPPHPAIAEIAKTAIIPKQHALIFFLGNTISPTSSIKTHNNIYFDRFKLLIKSPI